MSDKMNFTARCKSFFGLREGTTIMDFAKELKDLSLADKQEFCKMFNEAGLPTEEPALPKPA